jgi:hypothetical protein
MVVAEGRRKIDDGWTVDGWTTEADLDDDNIGGGRRDDRSRPEEQCDLTELVEQGWICWTRSEEQCGLTEVGEQGGICLPES